MAAPSGQMAVAQSRRPPAFVGRLWVGRRARAAGLRSGPFWAGGAGGRRQRDPAAGPGHRDLCGAGRDAPGKAARSPCAAFSRLESSVLQMRQRRLREGEAVSSAHAAGGPLGRNSSPRAPVSPSDPGRPAARRGAAVGTPRRGLPVYRLESLWKLGSVHSGGLVRHLP